ncbi:PP2C family protein-serine/threonine phosphatase [Flagellimonas allohymeniacidonis]|uniref:Serine/threonine-protein phosphatase n=1 Tax=Flagellimonas allohymeniacidonis TaxID=2517819 RepID=A0A4Q8QAK0_9FLAO|nr:protein phosphatase 2C domain-containing protein [Allomuricauda hymeniacidonis]TAI47342.1 serine/threonine-protein phosphatase [Allomuricauda hymeniacidonis]
MKLFMPASCHQTGKRSNNEDAIFPEAPTEENRLFLVCDGVGGNAKGEVASSLVCEGFSSLFETRPIMSVNEASYLSKGLVFVEEQFEDYIAHNPKSHGMATTLALLWLSDSENKALIGWVGDSRVYHIRNGEILFQTRDHSVVQDLLEMGEITEEEAKTHPKRNVITRAINGLNPTRIDQEVISELKPNDFFLVCSDGLLESVNSENIGLWFKEDCTPIEIKKRILDDIRDKAQDNYSMFILKLMDT